MLEISLGTPDDNVVRIVLIGCLYAPKLTTFFESLFIYFERERETDREHEQGRGSVRGRERVSQTGCKVSAEPDAGLDLMNHEIMT